MKREIAWEETAAKEFDRIPPPIQENIVRSLGRLVLEERGDVKRLQGATEMYRLRVGEYRVLFTLEGPLLVIHRVATRGGAYQG